MKLPPAVLAQLLGAAVVFGAGCEKESTTSSAANAQAPAAPVERAVAAPIDEATPVERAVDQPPAEAPAPAIAAPVKPEIVQPPKHVAPRQQLAPQAPPPPQLVPHKPRIRSSGHDCPGCGMG